MATSERAVALSAMFAAALGACLPLAIPAHADEDPMMHRVTYTVTADEPTTVGITAGAAEALGDIVYLELPSVGDAVTAGQVCG